MISIIGPINSGAATGGAGVATSTGTSGSVLRGYLIGAHIKYNDSPPGTTDVTIRTQGTSPRPPQYNLIVVSNNATDGWYYPRTTVHDVAGAAVSSTYDYLPLFDYVQVVIAQANNADSVDIWLMVENG